MKVAGIILAAGASSRMGSPKALLQYRGETFVDRLVRLFSAHCSPVIVVVGHHRDTIAAGIKQPSAAVLVHNPEPKHGQLSSLQCGLVAVPRDTDGVLFMPVDVPSVAAATIAALLTAFEQRAAAEALVVPRYRGAHGHPVLAAASIAAEILALPVTSAARDVIHRHVHATRYVDVDDAGILKDVDDAASYAGLQTSGQAGSVRSSE